MSNEMFMQIIQMLITLILAFVSFYLVPLIKAKVGKDQMELLLQYVNIAVKAASQLYTKEQWKEKKEYCMNYLKTIIDDKLSITLSDEELSAIIEGVLV